MDIFLLKLLFIALIIMSGLAGGLAPLRISLSPRGRRVMALGNAFAGGIFFGAALLHLLPDGQEHYGRVFPEVDYPVALLLASLGFLAVLFLEKVLARGMSHDAESDGRAVYPALLMLVLSIHSIIAGMSLGLERELLASLSLLVAILAHKSSAAFALGVSLKSAGASPQRLRRTALFFSLMTPLGVLVGALFALSQTGEPDLIEAIFDGLAAGTFLYIATLDITDEVFREIADRRGKYLLLAAAFGLMALIALFV